MKDLIIGTGILLILALLLSSFGKSEISIPCYSAVEQFSRFEMPSECK
jgi:hypothetical protein